MRLIQERRSYERLIGQLYIRLQNLYASYDTLKKQYEIAGQKCEQLANEVKELQALVAVQQATIESLNREKGE